MPLVELGPGQETDLPLAALRIRANSSSGTPVRLDATHEDGQVSIHRLAPGEIVLVPRPGLVRITVAPHDGTTFPESAKVGLTVHAEGAAQQHVEVREAGVGSMGSAGLVLVTFGSTAHVQATGPRPVPQWLADGVRALRQAQSLGSAPQWLAPSDWAVVVDGSASMMLLARDRLLERLFTLVCGAAYGWSGRFPQSVQITAAGANKDVTADVNGHVGDVLPFDSIVEHVPAPWCHVGQAISTATRAGAGLVLILTDGVPGDVEAVSALAAEHPQTTLAVVTVGVSRHGLRPGLLERWQEELGAFDEFDALPNTRVVALPVRRAGSDPSTTLDLDGDVPQLLAEAMLRLDKGIRR